MDYEYVCFYPYKRQLTYQQQSGSEYRIHLSREEKDLLCLLIYVNLLNLPTHLEDLNNVYSNEIQSETHPPERFQSIINAAQSLRNKLTHLNILPEPESTLKHPFTFLRTP